MRPYVPLGSIMAISVFTRPWPCVGMVLSSALNRSNPKNKMHNTELFNFSYQRFFPTRGRIRKISADITYSEWKYKNKKQCVKMFKVKLRTPLKAKSKISKVKLQTPLQAKSLTFCWAMLNNLHNSTFPSFNLLMFTKENGTTINNDRK